MRSIVDVPLMSWQAVGNPQRNCPPYGAKRPHPLTVREARMTESTAPPAPLQSVHTTTLPQFLHQGGLTLLVSTYQAGKLIVVRAEGDRANTHFRNFDTPMGL